MRRTKIATVPKQMQMQLERMPQTKEELLSIVEDMARQTMYQIGVISMQGLINAECELEAGAWHSMGSEVNRHGTQEGFVVADGQKIRLERPRLRSNGKEVPIQSYKRFQNTSDRSSAIFGHLIRGVSTRDYSGAIKKMAAGYGISKSVVSTALKGSTAAELREFCERRLDDFALTVLMIDGVRLGDTVFVVALGIDHGGNKRVLGFHAGSTENTTIVTALLSELADRGLQTNGEILAVLDGAKALVAGVKAHWGDRVLIQRCQVHKERNVLDHVPDHLRKSIRRKLRAAWGMWAYLDAKAGLVKIIRELETINHDAAASLHEGMEETLTIHRLTLPEELRKSLRSTNLIESCFSVCRRNLRRVKRWTTDDQKRRWLATMLLDTESRFRRIQGYKEMETLIARIHILVNKLSDPLTQEQAA